MSTFTPPQHPERTVKVAHLVFGLLFLGVAGTWLLVMTGTLQTGHLAYVLPALLVAAGVLGLVAVATGARRRDRAHGTVEAPAREPDEPTLRDEPHPLDAHQQQDELDELDEPDDLEHTAPLTPTTKDDDR